MHSPIDPATIAIRAENVTLQLGTRDAPVAILKGLDLTILRRGDEQQLQPGIEKELAAQLHLSLLCSSWNTARWRKKATTVP